MNLFGEKYETIELFYFFFILSLTFPKECIKIPQTKKAFHLFSQ